MLPPERRKLILSFLKEQSAATVADLCSRLDVSEMTIRRDLQALSREGLILRVHGGAMLNRSVSYEPPYLMRAAVNVEAKRAISRAAAKLIRSGDSIALDVGTTTLELARSISERKNITVLTASLPIAEVLARAQDIRLILTGGILRPQELSMVGHVPAHTLSNFHVDRAFIGIGGLHLDRGLTEYNLEDSLVKQAIIACAEQVIVVADSSKLQRTCFVSVADLSAVDVLVTDEGAPKDVLAALSHKGIEVLVARDGSPDQDEPG